MKLFNIVEGLRNCPELNVQSNLTTFSVVMLVKRKPTLDSFKDEHCLWPLTVQVLDKGIRLQTLLSEPGIMDLATQLSIFIAVALLSFVILSRM